MSAERAEHAVEAPLGGLEQSLIEEYLRTRGYDAAALAALPPSERDAVLKSASIYASGRLMEVESRAHYLQDLHDGSRRGPGGRE
jgi:hypothetical protein